MTTSPGFSEGSRNLLDISAEAFPVDRPVKQAGSRKTVVTQRTEEGHRAPVALWYEAAKANSFRRPSAQRSHVGLDPGLVDEDEALWIKASLPRSPAAAAAGHIKAALLKSEQRFF